MHQRLQAITPCGVPVRQAKGQRVRTAWLYTCSIRGSCVVPRALCSFCTPSNTPHSTLSFWRKFHSTNNFFVTSRLLSNSITLSHAAVSDEASAKTARSSSSKIDVVEGEFELVYRGPLRSAIRAVKLFSLSTCAIALVGGPVLVMMGNPSVPLIGRILMTSFVMTVGVSTTLILHWLMKGYVIEMYYDPKAEKLRVYTLTMFAKKRCQTFHLSEAGPPESLTAFSTFQAQGKSYFMHTEVMENKELLGKILGPYMALESSELWSKDRTLDSDTSNTK